MSERDEPAPEAHGVHGTQREDGKMQEEPEGTDGRDEQAWADATETGGEAS
jgi:hypothetical protein